MRLSAVLRLLKTGFRVLASSHWIEGENCFLPLQKLSPSPLLPPLLPPSLSTVWVLLRKECNRPKTVKTVHATPSDFIQFIYFGNIE